VGNGIVLVEDNDGRIARFRAAVDALPGKPELFLWHDSNQFAREFPSIEDRVGVISLDYELLPKTVSAPDPGSGIEAARFLIQQKTRCPVIVHTSSFDHAIVMLRMLHLAGWHAERVSPMGEDWTRRFWLPKVKTFLKI
jgi:hypothetical protein